MCLKKWVRISYGEYSGEIPHGYRRELCLLNECIRGLEPLAVSSISMTSVSIDGRRKRSRTRFSISAIDGFVFLRHWSRVPFCI